MNSETHGLKWEIQMKKTNMMHYLPKYDETNVESVSRQSHTSHYPDGELNVNVYQGPHTVPLLLKGTERNSQQAAYIMEEAQELGSSENETLKLRREYLKTQVALLEAQKDSLDKSNFMRGLVSGPSLNDINPNAKCDLDDRYKKLAEELQQQYIIQDYMESDSVPLKRSIRPSPSTPTFLGDIIVGLTTALRTERERAFKCRLQYEASESARFILEEKFNLARTEFQADKEFYKKQLEKLDTELKENTFACTELRKTNLSLNKSVLSMKNEIRQMEDDSREAAINHEKSLKTVKLELENQFKEVIQQTESIETDLIKEKSEYLRENETQRQLVLRLQEEVGNNQAKLTQLFMENDNLRKQIEEVEQEFNRKYQKELNLRLDIEMELQRQQREQEYVLGQMQAQFTVDQEDLTESLKNQYKRRISDLTEQHNVHIKSLEGQVKEFEHTVKELKSKLDCSKQIVSKQKVNRSSQTEYAEDMKSTNYINVVEIDALLDALWKERYDTYLSSQLNAAVMYNTEKETPKLSPPVHSDSEENKNTQTKQTQEAQYQELTNEVCRKQKQTEQALKAQQLTINSERKTLWSLIIEIVSTVIETNNVECLRLAEVLGISWIPISPPASLECLDSIDVNSLITEHSLAEIRQYSKDLVPQSWMTVLAESVAASSVFSSEVTKLICRQRDQLVRQSRSLKEFQDIIQKQLQIIQEQNIQSQKNMLVRQRRQFSKERTEQVPDLLSPEYMNRTQTCSLCTGGSFNREILVSSRCSGRRMDQVGSDITNELRSTIFPYKLPLVTNRYYVRNRPISTISPSILLPSGQEQNIAVVR